jgi:hypothetical protein
MHLENRIHLELFAAAIIIILMRLDSAGPYGNQVIKGGLLHGERNGNPTEDRSPGQRIREKRL